MATIIPNTKGKKTVSYKLRAYLGRDDQGKQIFRFKTWYVPDDLTPAKARKAAQKASDEFEKKARGEYEQEQKKRGEDAGDNLVLIPFDRFIKEFWFPIFVCNGEHKETTIEYYRNMSARAAEHFQKKPLERITALDIEKFFVSLHSGDKPLAPKTIKHCYTALKSIFSFAMLCDIIQQNPMDRVGAPKLEKKKVDVLSTDDIKRFLFTLDMKETPIDFRCMCLTLIGTGVRRGELMGLQWGDIDFTANTIQIKRNVVYTPLSGVQISTPKTHSSFRTIPMIDILAYTLLEYKQTLCSSRDTDFVFQKEGYPEQPRDPNTITRRLKRFMKSHNFPDMSPHDLRHTFATQLLANSSDIKSTQKILGHSDSATTLNFYVSESDEQMRTAANKLSNNWFAK